MYRILSSRRLSFCIKYFFYKILNEKYYKEINQSDINNSFLSFVNIPHYRIKIKKDSETILLDNNTRPLNHCIIHHEHVLV